MIAIDTNILVYAHRPDMPGHETARQALHALGVSGQKWGIPWPCLHEFIAVVTGPAFGQHATPLVMALNTIDTWIGHSHCSLLSEGAQHFAVLSGLSQRAQLRGGAIHDARIAALCLSHGVSELWTSDRDFQRFPDLRTRNPLIAGLHEPIGKYAKWAF
jgi:uncharacterized protein